MGGRSLVAALVAAALLLAGPSAARAGEPEAEAFFRVAKAAYSRKEYRPAAIAFEAAFREAPHPAALYNAALAWELAGEPDRAADAHHASLKLTDRLTEAQAKDARERLARLEKQIAVVDVEAPESALITLGHLERVKAPARFHVLPGEHIVTVTFGDGGRASRRVRAAAARRERIEFTAPTATDPPALPEDATPSAPPERGAEGAETTPDVGPDPPEGPSGALRVGGWVGTVSAVVFAGTAVGLGLSAIDARDDFEASGNTDVGARDRADTLRTWTNVAWVGTAVAGTVGIVLFIASSVAAPPASAELRLTPGGAALRGRF